MKFIILTFFFIFPFLLLAQNIDQSVIGSMGTTNSTSTISLDWTLGEWLVGTYATEEGLLTEGFHQPIISFIAVHDRIPLHAPKIDLSIAPNPVTDQVVISYNSSQMLEVTLELRNLQGQKLRTKTQLKPQEPASFQLSNLKAGTYLLYLRKPKGDILRTFKLIKI